ncbi:MAG: DUF72 domain-containing protein [Sphingomonadales bacterium]|nr:DUF72 domain-containing protein [Sphingomonadales bacterium]PIX64167.1 MAG: DUF72 domain-containing protein [Sphingomonadales bacterium CG_4_10_14_3_um_filter_58_15]NCO50379.1 DUF72 domain-containing protein [Sphingomonadales bacterium]NCO98666.1 DUF72 domain-containing protein [Sphingomonadales bacterium]NCP26753.1 DUF72 domain-containing protein [Sphingomonadales bacterium]
MADPRIRCGIGGWTFAPWRGTFYPNGLRQADELKYAGEHLGAIEINGTYYGTQKPESFAKWRDAVPEGFKFTVKASRYCTNRKDLREAGASIEKFVGQGLVELGDKLGPLFWQFMPTKKFDATEFEGFLKMLPEKIDGMPLRHALEVRHESFLCSEFIGLARQYNAAVVCSHSEKYPQISDQTADFSYTRLMCSREDVETGYSDSQLDAWAATAKDWMNGKSPDDMEYVSSPATLASARDVYMFVISGAKIRAPAAAQALMKRIED